MFITLYYLLFIYHVLQIKEKFLFTCLLTTIALSIIFSNEETHKRHHEFIEDVLTFIERNRKKGGFGLRIFKEKVHGANMFQYVIKCPPYYNNRQTCVK